MGSTKYALKVIEGQLRDHLYYLPENSELFLGRGANIDIVIDEDMVSRRHAKVLTFHNQIMLQDLNSTNGTRVNQQPIQDARLLKLGDILSVGTCVLELVEVTPGAKPNSPYDFSQPSGGMGSAVGSTVGSSIADSQPGTYGAPNAPTPPAAPVGNLGSSYPPPSQSGGLGMNPPVPSPMGVPVNPSMGAGNYSNMATLNGARPRNKPEVGTFPSAEVADILTLVERLVERRHDGVLAVFDPEEREGSIYLRGGRVYFATCEDPHRVIDIPVSPQQALVKVCCWAQGRYKVKSVSALPAFEQEINEDSRSLLEQVRHNCLEMNQLRAQLPPMNSRLMVSQPLNAPLTSLSPDHLYIFQLALNQYDVRSMVDCHQQGEREGIKALIHLLEHGYLQR